MLNFCIDNNTFSNGLKKADITNCRSVSILPVLSKSFERFLYGQIYKYIDIKLSKAQCGFRKSFSTHYSLVAIIER